MCVCVCEDMCLAQLKNMRGFFGAFPTLRLHWYGKRSCNWIRYFCFHFPNRSLFEEEEKKLPSFRKRWWKETYSNMGEAHARNRKWQRREKKRRVYWYRIPLTMPHLFQVHYLNCSFLLFSQFLLSFSLFLFFALNNVLPYVINPFLFIRKTSTKLCESNLKSRMRKRRR